MLKIAGAGTFALALATMPIAAVAQTNKAETLYETLLLPEVITLMREEGLTYGSDLADDFFPGRTIADWDGVVNVIYNADKMEGEIKDAFSAALEGDDVDSMLAFFQSELGQEIVQLEISARRALKDEQVEQLAEENAAIAMQDETDRFLQVEEFVDVNNVIESNVVGALNSNFAFYTGLLDGGAFGDDLTEEQILNDVWNQEPDIRQNTTEWAFSFLLLAYQPLNDSDLRQYIEFSKTDAGQELNGALFEAFDGMLERISRDLGLATSKYMGQQEL
ncbi:hypothetical protein SAMN05444003_0736 [Cognatiyoonia sediminum]|uniref:DUF2059 domain-containing protein n=2 Tax=Cognatiyoonia sediminum TaxID=1508389 RepID=A0A1M5MB51_9RHOB|nr:hypothetical protein SAMN05444003_0736 [Cognatiyoonia sediminum]